MELSAGTGLSNSIIKFGDNTHTVTRRRLSNFFFECNSASSIDAIEIDGLANSEFDDVEIRDCSSYGVRTVGTSTQNYSNVFEGGGISATAAAANGVYLGYGANNWRFKGTRLGNSATSPTGIGVEFEGRT